jgi:preprotein translocase subunit SecA
MTALVIAEHDNATLKGATLNTVTADLIVSYGRREEEIGGAAVLREVERRVILTVIDRKWREHLYEMDYLQEGIGLRAMAQRDPLVEYQREGYELFSAMMDAVKEELASLVFNVQVEVEDGKKVSAPALDAKPAQVSALSYTASDGSETVTKNEVTRNAPCPCGSGKKYKRCHGAA